MNTEDCPNCGGTHFGSYGCPFLEVGEKPAPTLMDEAACLAAIAEGETAFGILTGAMPGIERKFKRVDKAIVDLLAEVRRKFPNAQYYTASGGFTLMLGSPHANDRGLTSQQELIALGGNASIGDGDF